MKQHSSFSKALFNPYFIDEITAPDFQIGKRSLSHPDRFCTKNNFPDYASDSSLDSEAMQKHNSTI